MIKFLIHSFCWEKKRAKLSADTNYKLLVKIRKGIWGQSSLICSSSELEQMWASSHTPYPPMSFPLYGSPWRKILASQCSHNSIFHNNCIYSFAFWQRAEATRVPSELGVLTSAPFFSSCAYGKEYLLAAWKSQHRTFSHVTEPTKIFCAFVFFLLLFLSIVFLSVFESFWVFPELSRKMTVCPHFKCFLELEYSESLTINISWWTCLRYTANQYFAQMLSARR